MAKRKHISPKQMYQLIQWIDQNRTTISDNGWTIPKLAEEATKAISEDFTFLREHINKAVGVLDFRWKRQITFSPDSPRQRSVASRKDLRVVANAVRKLSQDLGAKLPEEFAELCGTLEG